MREEEQQRASERGALSQGEPLVLFFPRGRNLPSKNLLLTEFSHAAGAIIETRHTSPVLAPSTLSARNPQRQYLVTLREETGARRPRDAATRLSPRRRWALSNSSTASHYASLSVNKNPMTGVKELVLAMSHRAQFRIEVLNC